MRQKRHGTRARWIRFAIFIAFLAQSVTLYSLVPSAGKAVRFLLPLNQQEISLISASGLICLVAGYIGLKLFISRRIKFEVLLNRSQAFARGAFGFALAMSAFALPFRDHSIDIVMCSQLLHHFDWTDAEHVLRELDRVAARAVIISDLRRSWIAAAGFALVANVLRFHRVTRHDGVVSVLRGFTSTELRELVQRATGVTPKVRHRLGYRLTARWAPRTGAPVLTA